MYKFCYIHNSQWHYNVVSFWWWNIPYTSQLCRVGLFLKGTSVKLQCLVFCLLTSACSSKPNSGIIFFQEIFPNPPSHLPPFLPDYFPCPFAVLSVPGTSLCFSTCYTVLLCRPLLHFQDFVSTIKDYDLLYLVRYLLRCSVPELSLQYLRGRPIYVNQIIMLYTLNLNSDVCQLLLKLGKEEKWQKKERSAEVRSSEYRDCVLSLNFSSVT